MTHTLNVTQDARLRNIAEKEFCLKCIDVISDVVMLGGYAITDIRFARKVKCFGAETSGFHIYTYRSGKKEVWINLDGNDLSDNQIKFYVKRLHRNFAFNSWTPAIAITDEMVKSVIGDRKMRMTEKVKRQIYATWIAEHV